jgi:hypothetical protein
MSKIMMNFRTKDEGDLEGLETLLDEVETGLSRPDRCRTMMMAARNQYYIGCVE